MSLFSIATSSQILQHFLFKFNLHFTKVKSLQSSTQNFKKKIVMALEWVILSYAAAAEAVIVLLLTLPGTYPLRKGLISVTRNLLKPFLSVIPFCLFLLLDMYWKYETRPTESCTPTELMRHQKSVVKSQRNALLIASTLMFYWMLYSVTRLVTRVELLNQRVEKMQNQE